MKTIYIKRKKSKFFFKYIFIAYFFILSIFLNFTYIFATDLESTPVDISTDTVLDLHCFSNIAMDYESGYVLYNNEMNKKVYPASTTKILTAILAIENLDLDEKVVIYSNVINSIPEESSLMGIELEEIFSVEELLYGLMLPSGNDAALALAEAVSGNVDEFVKLMNNKLVELSCFDTHFTNPHGYYDENHYTTAFDMAKIFRYCLQNETFKKIIGTSRYVISSTNKKDSEMIFNNSNRFINKNYPKIFLDYVKGGKTGYTYESKNTLISYGIKDGKTVIVASFGGILNSSKIPYTYTDSKLIYDYVFDNFSSYKIADKSDYTFKIYDIKNSMCHNVSLKDNVYALLKENNIAYTTYNIKVDYEKIDKIVTNSEFSSEYDDSNIGKVTINYITSSGSFNNTYDLKYDYYEIIQKDYTKEHIPVYITIFILLLILISCFFVILKNMNKKNIKNIRKNY